MLSLADKFTVARLYIAPVVVAAYLAIPVDGYQTVFWVVCILCCIAELTDFVDGRVARARKEVSDFGKLADPFCDVIYRIAVFLVFLLPVGGLGYPVAEAPEGFAYFEQMVFAVHDGDQATYGSGLLPFIPVLLMVLRELVAGALRSMAATKGLVLAARNSGKIKAWFQGFTLISVVALPACLGGPAAWHLTYAAVLAWFCALLSVISIIEYIVVNRGVLAQLVATRPLKD